MSTLWKDMRKFSKEMRESDEILKKTNRKAETMKNLTDAQAMQALLDGLRIKDNNVPSPSKWYEMHSDGIIRDEEGDPRILSFGTDRQFGFSIVPQEWTFLEAAKRVGTYASGDGFLMTVTRWGDGGMCSVMFNASHDGNVSCDRFFKTYVERK